ncbi:MAG: type III-B CRISPR module-associated protein Cmr3 [Desulfurococcales archaeon]|nr:type III-B CRISPR module-associated protein Cmr3 [Desulfurococcales archaeon]
MRVLELRPLDMSFFRPPAGVTQAGVHGPSAMVKSLSYPMPSTIAGALAAIAYRTGKCSLDQANVDVDEFEDQYTCLEALLGEEFALRPGLARVNGEVYAYTGSRELTLLKTLLDTGKKASQSGSGRYSLRHVGFIGIALQRGSKAVVEGNLYHADAVDYPGAGASILVIAHGATGDLPSTVIPLGAETRMAALQPIEINEEQVKLYNGAGGTGRWRAILLTPALLRKAPSSVNGVILASSQSLAAELGELLVEGSVEAVKKCVEEARVEVVPRGELQAEILNSGWSMLEGRARRPYLILPPGTEVSVRIKSRECVEEVAKKGLGAHSRLGWGTAALRPDTNPTSS